MSHLTVEMTKIWNEICGPEQSGSAGSSLLPIVLENLEVRGVGDGGAEGIPLEFEVRFVKIAVQLFEVDEGLQDVGTSSVYGVLDKLVAAVESEGLHGE